MTATFAPLVPELIVSDINRSITFYTAVLSFAVLYARPEDRFVYLDRDGAQLMLEQPAGRTFLAGELVHPYGRGVNFQITVTDVDALYAKVRASGATVRLALEDEWYRRDSTLAGNRQFVVQDPDGYLLRLFADLGTRSAQRSASRALSTPRGTPIVAETPRERGAADAAGYRSEGPDPRGRR